MADREGQQAPLYPPGEPPPAATSEITWRLAARLYGEHAAPPPVAGESALVCRVCGQRWPCSGRRLAELGLRAAQA